jgi:membrane-associated phospholipid phosphatase
MQPLPEDKGLNGWGRLIHWVTPHQRIARLVILAVSLFLILAILPAYIRAVFWNGLKSNPFLTGMLLIFSALAISLVWSVGQRLDAWMFLVFNLRGSRPIWLDRVMSGFTQLGSGVATLGIALAFFLSGDRLLAYELALGTVTLWLVVELLKFGVHRSRPFISLTQARIVGLRAIGRSFPSGHTSQVFFMATLTAQHFHASVWVVLLLNAIALLVGITRMYVGAHYPRDVLAGAILGSAWGLLGTIIIGM